MKFRYFETRLFVCEASDETVERLSATYTSLVHEAVLKCRFIRGAEEFLERAHGRAAMHVASGTPDDELKDIVERRGLAHYFASVQSVPTTKNDAFRAIVRGWGYAPERVRRSLVLSR